MTKTATQYVLQILGGYSTDDGEEDVGFLQKQINDFCANGLCQVFDIGNSFVNSTNTNAQGMQQQLRYVWFQYQKEIK